MNFTFDKNISYEVLCNYLSRAITHYGVGEADGTLSRVLDDDIRMFLRWGVKYIGRASHVWGTTDDIRHFQTAKERADIIHAADSEIILQACVFESIYRDFVNTVEIPRYVFEAFGLPYEKRCFSYEKMLFPSGRFVDMWTKGASVEDINQPESRMWIYYRATSYIAAGYEGIHFGQVHLIGAEDKGFENFKTVVDMIRDYAKLHARRHYVLCDAHTHGIVIGGESLFDFNAYPIRLHNVDDHNTDGILKCECRENHMDVIFGRSKGGKSPSGWTCDSFPYLVEFDNFGITDRPGEIEKSGYYPWGYDEITWFALQPKNYRHEFLHYIWNWVNDRFPNCYVQMPSRRNLCAMREFVWKNPDMKWLEDIRRNEALRYTAMPDGTAKIFRTYYSANNLSDSCPFGYGDEDVICELFHKERKTVL